MVSYQNYKFYFPIRALGLYEYEYLPYMRENDLVRKR